MMELNHPGGKLATAEERHLRGSRDWVEPGRHTHVEHGEVVIPAGLAPAALASWL